MALDDLERPWEEDRYISFSAAKVDELIEIVKSIQSQAACLLKESEMWKVLGFPDTHNFRWLFEQCQDRSTTPLISRFDFVISEEDEKFQLLEINTEAVGLLVESTVAQSQWKDDVHPTAVQREDGRQVLRDYFNSLRGKFKKIFFMYTGQGKLELALFLSKIAEEQNLTTEVIDSRDIHWIPKRRPVTSKGEIVDCLYLNTHWRSAGDSDYVIDAYKSGVTFIEPPAAALLGSKALLAHLYNRWPETPGLLPTFHKIPQDSKCTDWVQKPFFGVRSKGVSFVDQKIASNMTLENYIYQKRAYPKRFTDHPKWQLVCVFVFCGIPSAIVIRDCTETITGFWEDVIPYLIEG